MAKTFYTERDIEDMHAQGVTAIEIHDAVVLTDLARERAFKLGIRLHRVASTPSLREQQAAVLFHRVKAAVLAALGDRAVDPVVLDAVIRRVLAALPPT
jgi:hypothetical protein